MANNYVYFFHCFFISRCPFWQDQQLPCCVHYSRCWVHYWWTGLMFNTSHWRETINRKSMNRLVSVTLARAQHVPRREIDIVTSQVQSASYDFYTNWIARVMPMTWAARFKKTWKSEVSFTKIEKETYWKPAPSYPFFRPVEAKVDEILKLKRTLP